MSWQEILERQRSWTKENSSSYRLTQEEAVELYKNAPLHELSRSANQRRISMLGSNKVTFLVDRNINYTNVCTINCQFCSFYRPPGHEETYTQSYQEISQRIVELEEIGGSRILMQGGVNRSLKFDWYLELLEFLQVNHPTIHFD